MLELPVPAPPDCPAPELRRPHTFVQGLMDAGVGLSERGRSGYFFFLEGIQAKKKMVSAKVLRGKRTHLLETRGI